MADDFLDQAFGEQPQAEAEPVVPEPTPEAEPEPQAEAPTPEPEPEPEVEKPRERVEPGYVPIAAVMDERDKRKDLERRIAAYEAQERQKPEVPDPYDDPQAYSVYMRGELDAALQAQKIDMSWQFAVTQHGEEDVSKARDWAVEKAQNDPAFRSQIDTVFANQAMPIEWIVQQHKRDALLTDIGDPSKLDDWFAREAAKRGYAMQSAPAIAAPAVVTPALKAAVPPRSIASDASPTQKAVDNGNPMAGLDAIFSR